MSKTPAHTKTTVVANSVESSVTNAAAPQAQGVKPVDAARTSGWRAWRDRLLLQEDLNFLLTNRIPRIALTRFMGWFSQIRHPWVRDASIAVWKACTEIDLSEARKRSFTSLHDCFIRELKPGARPIDPRPDVLTSPSDGIIGAHGRIENGLLLQAKGMPYTLRDLLGDEAACVPYLGGHYLTLRLTSAMYHRFHAPLRGTVLDLRHLDGDTWNVNPIALKRVERLFCRNERAAIRLQASPTEPPITIVAVAAILVSGLRIHGVPPKLFAGYRGVTEFKLNRSVERGEELGWFEHGSTLIVLTPPGYAMLPGLKLGCRVLMGQGLVRACSHDVNGPLKA